MRTSTQILILLISIFFSQISLQAQVRKGDSNKKLSEKIERSNCKERCRIILECTEKDYIPIDHFKDFFNVHADKFSFQDMLTDTVNIRGKNIPCVKQFILIIPKPDPCRDDPFRLAQIQPVVLFYNEIFSSFILGVTSNIAGDVDKDTKWFIEHSGSIGFKISSRCPGKKIRYEISSNEGYFTTISGTTYTESKENQIFPKIPWNYEMLLCLSERTSGSIIFKFWDENGQLFEKVENVYYRSPNDCIFGVDLKPLGFSNGFVSMRWMFSAYVNEESAFIAELRNKIINANPQIKSWGFAGGDHLSQIEAIWNYLQNLGVKYSGITTTVDPFQSYISSQKVRDVATSIKEGQANCIDGSVLFASLLQQMEFPSYIVIVPGHAFFAVEIHYYEIGKEVTKLLLPIETTVIGSGSSLLDAMTIGNKNIQKNKPNCDHMLINSYRLLVKPIPFKNCK